MKTTRHRINAMAGDTEMEVLEKLGGQTKGIAKLVAHYLDTYKIYERNQELKKEKFAKIMGGK